MTHSGSPLTILGIYLHPYVRTGGHRRYLELMQGLARRGHRCLLLLDPRLRLDLPAVELLRLDPASAQQSRRPLLPASLRYRAAVRRALPSIRAALAEQPPAAVVVFGETHYPPSRLLTRELRVPLLFGFRSLPVEVGRIERSEAGRSVAQRLRISARIAKYRLYERAVARHADRIIFQSPHDRDRFLARNPAATARSSVIRGNIGEPWYRSADRDTNRSSALQRIIYVGALNTRKGVGYLLEAFAQLAAELPRLKLDVAGEGSLRAALEARAASLGLADRIGFLGRVGEPLAAIAGADLLVVPSLFDSYPNTILEALHVGTPVIAARSGGIPDMLEHDELLFPPADASAIADRIRLLASDPAAYRRVRDLCSRRRSCFEFDWPAEWERVIREMASE